MEARTCLLSKRHIAHTGTTLTEEAWQHRQAKITEELKTDMPALRRLRASRLEFAYEIEAATLQILVFLKEIPQLNLQFGSRLDAKGDIYLQDLEEVHRNQRSILELYERAYKSTVDPAQDERIQELRQRLADSSTAGQIHVHTSVVGEAYRFSDLPKHLPNTREFQILAKVLELRIGEVTIVTYQNLPKHPGEPILFRSGSKIICYRSAACRHVMISTRLQTAMDLKISINLIVVVERSWIDGRPSRITLVDVPIENGGDPSS
jgi:hypothetical protein